MQVTDKSKYNEAVEKVKEIKNFYIHLIVFILVNSFLIGLNLYLSPGVLWFVYGFAGWGLGLIGHAVHIFGDRLLFSKEWEEKEIQKYIQKHQKKKNESTYY